MDQNKKHKDSLESFAIQTGKMSNLIHQCINGNGQVKSKHHLAHLHVVSCENKQALPVTKLNIQWNPTLWPAPYHRPLAFMPTLFWPNKS